MSKITMAHGGGGRLQNDLIRNTVLPYFSNDMLANLPDGAVTPEGLVISSDSFIITPRFFPGGNIGKLAVAGTVNDILMAGGIPRYLTCSLLLEEGLDTDELQNILDAMSQTAQECGVMIVTGDTKVLPRGTGDGVYINTTGVGIKRNNAKLSASRIAPGDKIIVSGNIGEHGLAVLAERCNLECGSLLSDCRPLIDAVSILTGNQSDRHEVKFMRDATRGGVLGIISEIFENTNCNATVFSDRLPVSSEAAAVSKLLGVDPGFAACEGCLAAVVSAEYAEKCVEELHKITAFRKAAVIGEVSVGNGEVYMQSEWGSLRKLILPSGDQLPRIC